MGNKFQSLELWRHALVSSVRNDSPDLTARQMAILLSVYVGEGPNTVRGLALTLNVSKPAISRALDRLGELGYIRRQRDETDRRSVIVQRTVAGAVFMTDFAALVDAAQSHIASIPERDISFAVDPAAIAAAEAALQEIGEPEGEKGADWLNVAA